MRLYRYGEHRATEGRVARLLILNVLKDHSLIELTEDLEIVLITLKLLVVMVSPQ